MKSLIIKSLNAGVFQKPLLAYKSSLPRIVYYHLVSNIADIPYYYKKNLFTEKLLDDQLKWYKKNGYTFITVDEAVHIVENKEKAKKTVAFTTDDGFIENYTIIAPIFHKYNIKSTLFMIGNCLDNKDLMWNNKVNLIQNRITAKKEAEICAALTDNYNLPSKDIKDIVMLSDEWPMAAKDGIANHAWELAALEPLSEYLKETKPYMSNEQVKELVSLGYTVGSHSMSHPEFSKLTKEEAKSEMENSKRILSATFNTAVNYFAYPYGKRPVNNVEEDVLQNGTYKILFGTKSNLTNNQNNKIWERDKMEQGKELGEFWFSAVPVLRHTILRPLGIYK